MTYKIRDPKLHGKIRAIPSKSHVHRLLIAAALYGGETELVYGPQDTERSEDIDATITCLRALGAQISWKEDSGTLFLEVSSIGLQNLKDLPKPVKLFCGESGSTLRFLLPIVCALGIEAEFYPLGRLPQRPLSPLREELIRHGCRISEQGEVPVRVRGALFGGTFQISGDVSSQFVTGLAMALPLLQEPSRIAITGTLESKPYVDLTLDVLAKFGVSCKLDEQSGVLAAGRFRFDVKTGVKQTFCVEGDWSNAAFWLAAGALAAPDQSVTVTGLSMASKQGDKKMVDLLKEFGAHIQVQEQENGTCEVTVSPAPLSSILIDASDIPDLVPILSLVATAAEGSTMIHNAMRLRYKESDRLQSTETLLRKLGGKVLHLGDGLVIDGGYRYPKQHALFGGRVDSCNDHRIAMTAAIAATISCFMVEITNAEAVNKSYPQFWSDFAALNRR